MSNKKEEYTFKGSIKIESARKKSKNQQGSSNECDQNDSWMREKHMTGEVI